MLELTILGFLAEGPLHGYDLRQRVGHLSGFARPVSDGSLYPAIDRLVRTGLIDRETTGGAAGSARRHVLTLSENGRAALVERLRAPQDVEITDGTRFLVVLAFLSHLPSVEERDQVLRRRLAFLEQPASFFYEAGRPVALKEVDDPYRRGMFVVAGATSRAERAWLHELLDAGA